VGLLEDEENAPGVGLDDADVGDGGVEVIVAERVLAQRIHVERLDDDVADDALALVGQHDVQAAVELEPDAHRRDGLVVLVLEGEVGHGGEADVRGERRGERDGQQADQDGEQPTCGVPGSGLHQSTPWGWAPRHGWTRQNESVSVGPGLSASLGAAITSSDVSVVPGA
jgi:hypothetical protein